LDGENRLDPETVAESVRALGKDARVLNDADAIAEHLGAETRAGDVVLIMSNGSFDGLCEKLLKRLGTATQLTGEATSR
jgi:UDP-N-acetylmuramate: L-alanyl-gamma-D-glutamyl-meso-diaminopimelate ligase